MPDIDTPPRTRSRSAAPFPWVTHLVAAIAFFAALVGVSIADHGLVAEEPGVDDVDLVTAQGFGVMWFLALSPVLLEVAALRAGRRTLARLLALVGTGFIAFVTTLPVTLQLQSAVSHAEVVTAVVNDLVVLGGYLATLVALHVLLRRRTP